VDWIFGQARVIDTYWHFDPARNVSVVDGGLLATGASGAPAWLLHDQGELTLSHGGAVLGWCSPRYGSLVPTFAARVRWAQGRRSQATWIGADASDRPPLLRQIALDGVDDPSAVSVVVEHGGGSTRTLVRAGAMTTGEGRLLQGGDVRTDGRLVQLRTAGPTASVCLAAASRLEAPASPFAAISVAGPTPDLHVALGGTGLELWATSPPSNLRIQLARLHRVHRLRLNGREALVAAGGATDVTVRAAQWGEIARGAGRTGAGSRAATDPPYAAVAEGIPC
jgi:hypothetical protein